MCESEHCTCSFGASASRMPASLLAVAAVGLVFEPTVAEAMNLLAQDDGC